MTYKEKQDLTEVKAKARAAVKRVKKLKDKRGLSFTAMGDLLGVDRITVFRWYHGKTLPVFPGALEEALDEVEGEVVDE